MSTHHAVPTPSGSTIAAVASLRARLWDAGFRPVAVYNPDVDHPSAGKAPKGREWQHRARLDPPEAADASPEPDALNTGILCDGLRAIDIDVDDPNLASQIKLAALNRFGETSVRYRANSGRTLLVYRAKEGEPVKRVISGTLGKVEVLGKGQQFVAFGRHHSGADLQWLYDPPGEVMLDQIPMVSEDDISQLLRFAAPIIQAQPENFRQGVGAVSNHGLQAADALQVIAAVCAIPNDGPADWEGWNRVGMAIWAATNGGEAGRSAFHAWSQQNPAYDEAATTARWDHYRTSPPTKIGAGTLFHMAKQATREPDDSQLEDVPPPRGEEDYLYADPLPTEPVTPRPSVLYVIKEAWAEKDIPRRPWVAPGYLLRGSVTAMAGAGSAGKSSLVVCWTTAHALGKDFGRFRSMTGKPLKVLSYNVEDDADELRRRYSATCRQFGCKTADILPNLTLCGPNDIGTLMTTARDGRYLVNTRAMDQLEELIGDTKPDAAWLDPFVELHDAEENDNTAVRAVMARLRTMARAFNLGLGVLFHTRKGIATPGDPDSIRGASSIVGAGRVAITVNVMTKEEADQLGVRPENRRDYFRVDDAKKNYSRVEDAEWFERVEFELDNHDFVAVPGPWTPPTTALGQDKLLEIVRVVAQGSPAGPWSPRLSSDERSIAQALDRLGYTSKAAQQQALLQIKTAGLVEVAAFKKARKTREDSPQGLRTSDGEPRSVGWWDVEDGQNG